MELAKKKYEESSNAKCIRFIGLQWLKEDHNDIVKLDQNTSEKR